MITAALIGNPNCGKTTIFNRLTGSIQKVGNWAGVTVERKQGYIRNYNEEKILIVDLPGIYSLSPYSPEEVVSRDFLIGSSEEQPDVAVCIVDASNMERSMYLLSQVSDMGIPMVVVMNMIDVARDNGISVDQKGLENILGCEVVMSIGVKAHGTDSIAQAIKRAHDRGKAPNTIVYNERLEQCISDVSGVLQDVVRDDLLRWASLKFVEKDPMVRGELPGDLVARGDEFVKQLEKDTETDGMQFVAESRYNALAHIHKTCTTKVETTTKSTLSDRIDRIILHRVFGLPIFIGVMFVVYYISIQTIGTMGSDFINDGYVTYVSQTVDRWMIANDVEPILRGLCVDGILAGVGAVIGFLPQIIVLFLCLQLLEEIGYLARVAYLLDRLFCKFGLSGKTVIPIVIGIGCSVPAIMSTRTIEDHQNRNITVMTTSFVPCSAKLPIILVIIGAFFGGSALMVLAMYVVGIFMILISGIILKKFTGIVGRPAPFIMELPQYHAPTAINVLTGVTEKSWAFVKKAGTIILLSAVLIWFLASFDWGMNYVGGEDLNKSMLAGIGGAVTGLFVPCGFGEHWELTVCSITGLMAKENLLATLSVLIGAAVDQEGMPVAEALNEFLRGNAGIAVAFLLFNLICAPCFAAIGAMRRELGTWRKTGIAVLYQTVLAYMVATIFYQFYCLFTGRGLTWMIILAVVFVLVIAHFLFNRHPTQIFEPAIRAFRNRGGRSA